MEDIKEESRRQDLCRKIIPDEEQIRSSKKRVQSSNTTDAPPSKKPRIISNSVSHRHDGDMLSLLSDEVLIRILKLLPTETVLLCQSVSKRWCGLSTDGEVWRSLFWDRFIQPNFKNKRWKYHVHNREEKWIKEQKKRLNPATDQGQKDKVVRIDWKARFRLRHNWSRGAADVREIGLEEEIKATTEQTDEGDKATDARRLMVRIIDGRVVTVDQTYGLRVWELRKNSARNRCIARTSLDADGFYVPTALAVDNTSEADATRIVVGFQDGGFGIWKLNDNAQAQKEDFSKIFTRQGSGEESAALAAAAYSHPHLLTITESQVLSLYVFEGEDTPSLKSTHGAAPACDESSNAIKAPRLLTSLKSHTSWPPVSLSLRSTPQAIVASIAYALPTYTSGWSVGLQELHISHNGTISHSRLASATEPGFHPLLSPSPSAPRSRSSTPGIAPNSSDGRGPSTVTRPSSLSYSHPYLLASHANNTLTLYLVTSTQDDLKISTARTLWGHTSSVSGAHVGGRGKAVSISARGEELRVWELERGLASRRLAQDQSVRVRAGGHIGIESGNMLARNKGNWIGFDEEVVVVLKEAEDGANALVVYDFT